VSAELDRIRQFRAAARLAVRTEEATLQSRYYALLDLVDAADAEPDLLVRRWSRVAIWEESREFLGMGDEPSEVVPEPFERAQRQLRDEGYSSCPRCLAHVATNDELASWRDLRRGHIVEVERRERAVDG
jgi:hypothetical protein